MIQRFKKTSTEVPVSGNGIIVIQKIRESEGQRVRVRESGSQKVRKSESLQSYPRNTLGWSQRQWHNCNTRSQGVRESGSQRAREFESQRVMESESLQCYSRNNLGWSLNYRVSQSGHIRSL